MKQIKFANQAPFRLIYGCMRIAGDNSSQDKAKGKHAIQTAFDEGYNHFDHADIYGAGACESLFGELLKASPSIRDEIIITSKAGIRVGDTPNVGDPKCYDFSHDYLTKQVEGSLNRLNTDYLDLFLLHRPDYLFNAELNTLAGMTVKANLKLSSLRSVAGAHQRTPQLPPLRVRVAQLRQEIHQKRRTATPPPHPHRREKIRM